MADYKGLTIRFDGDASRLIAALREVDSATGRTTSLLSRINTAMQLDPNNPHLYSLRVQEMGKQVDAAKTRLRDLNKTHDENSQKLADAQRKLNKLTAEGKKGTDEWRQQKLAVQEFSEKVYQNAADIELATVKLNALTYAEQQAEIARRVDMGTLGDLSRSFREYADGVDYIGEKMQKLGTFLTVGTVTTLMTAGRSVLRQTEDYGNAISKVGGYLDITGSELERMSDLALKFGKDTRYSAVEAADAISELAKGGMTQAQIEGGALDATLQLASAGNLDLARAAEIAVQAINVFKLSAEDSSDVADALAGAANRSTAEVADLADAFRYVSGWSGLAEYSINDVSGALGLLSDRGLRGEMAGTALRNFMQRVAAPTDTAAKLLEKYGFAAYDAEGKLKPLTKLVEELNQAFGELSDEERNETLNKIFGARGLPAAIGLMQAGSAELDNYIEATKRVGYAEVMAQAQMGDLGWALEYLRGEFETFQVNLGSAFTPMLIAAAEAAEGLLAQFNNLSKEEQMEWAKGLLDIATLGPKLLIVGTALRGFAAASRGLSVWYDFKAAFAESKKVLGDGATMMQRFGEAAAKASGGTLEAGKAMSILSAGLQLLGVAAAAFVAIKLWQEIEKDRRRTENLNNSLESARDLLAGKGPRTDKLADSIYASGKAARDTKTDVDNMLQSLNNFFERVDETFSDVEADSSRLNYAAEVIKRLAGDSNASAEAQQELNAALAVYNAEAGTNYQLHSDTGTVIYDENDAVVNLKDSIYRLIEARKAEAKVAAYQSLLEDAYKEQAAAQQTLNDARTAYFDIIDRRQRGETGYDVSDYALQKAKDDYYEARDAVIATDLAVDGLIESLGDATQEQMRAAEATHNALAENLLDIEGLSTAVEEAGLNVNDFVGLTEQEFAEMVDSASGNMEVLAGKLSEWLLNHGDIDVTFDGDASGAEEAAEDANAAAESVETDIEVTYEGDPSDAVQAARDVVGAEQEVDTSINVTFTGTDYLSGLIDKIKRGLSGLAGSYTPNPYRNRGAGGIRTHADGGIAVAAARYHAGGSIVNVPNTGYPLDLVGEAGAEAIVPLTNRRYSQPFVDLIADGVSRRMGGGTSYNLYINGARVNDDPQIRGQFIDLMQTLQRKGAMNDGA